MLSSPGLLVLVFLLLQDHVQRRTGIDARSWHLSTFASSVICKTRCRGGGGSAAVVDDDNPDDEHVLIWEEEEEGSIINPRVAESSRSSSPKRRKRIFWGKLNDDFYYYDDSGNNDARADFLYDSSALAVSANSASVPPHPLRTDLFRMKIRWRGRKYKKLMNRTLTFEFSNDGYVRCVRQDDTDAANKPTRPTSTMPRWPSWKRRQPNQFWVGKWKLSPSGLTWTIPLELDERRDHDRDNAGRRYKNARTTTKESNSKNERAAARRRRRRQVAVVSSEHTFYAGLHLNPFGAQPKLLNGVILRDRRDYSGRPTFLSPWFRPIVATFSGAGIGNDTIDFLYENRKFGLS